MPSDGAIYVDGEQKVNYISTREALRILDGFGNNSASVMIGKSDYILIYDASRKLIIDGEAYLPSGYLVMKSCNGLQAIDDDNIAEVSIMWGFANEIRMENWVKSQNDSR